MASEPLNVFATESRCLLEWAWHRSHGQLSWSEAALFWAIFISLSAPVHALNLSPSIGQSEASIQVTWSLSANQKVSPNIGRLFCSINHNSYLSNKIALLNNSSSRIYPLHFSACCPYCPYHLARLCPHFQSGGRPPCPPRPRPVPRATWASPRSVSASRTTRPTSAITPWPARRISRQGEYFAGKLGRKPAFWEDSRRKNEKLIYFRLVRNFTKCFTFFLLKTPIFLDPWSSTFLQNSQPCLQASRAACQRACAQHPTCEFWTWGKGTPRGPCYLKTARENVSPGLDSYVSGSKHCRLPEAEGNEDAGVRAYRQRRLHDCMTSLNSNILDQTPFHRRLGCRNTLITNRETWKSNLQNKLLGFAFRSILHTRVNVALISLDLLPLNFSFLMIEEKWVDRTNVAWGNGTNRYWKELQDSCVFRKILVLPRQNFNIANCNQLLSFHAWNTGSYKCLSISCGVC